MIELNALLLDLKLCSMNYDCVFRSYNPVFFGKIVLSVQRKLRLFLEESQCYCLFSQSYIYYYATGNRTWQFPKLDM